VNIREALRYAVERIEGIGAQTPLLDAEVLLCAILSVDRLYLVINGAEPLTEEQLHRYQNSIETRMAGVPVQYIVGTQEFMGMDFHVEEGVLIPRSDTEILVEAVIEWINEMNSLDEPVKIADLGTGSGAIALSLAKLVEKANVYAVDISPKALKVAQMNGDELQVTSVAFLLGNLFDPLKELGIEGKLDVLVSNPPYIPEGIIKGLQVEVACYEPLLALDGGEDGLNFYRRLIGEGWFFLKTGGLLAMEIGHDQADDIEALVMESGRYKNVRRIKDLAGIERVITAERH